MPWKPGGRRCQKSDKMLKKEQDVKKATEGSVKWVCGEQNDRGGWGVSAWARGFPLPQVLGLSRKNQFWDWDGLLCSGQCFYSQKSEFSPSGSFPFHLVPGGITE